VTTLTTRAALVREPGAPITVEEIELNPPGPGEVLIRVAGASLCHSDLSVARGVLRAATPVVLGHEASGTVTALGPGVTEVAVGDPVLLLWNPPCGDCWFCTHDEPHLCEHSADRASQVYGATTDGAKLYPALGLGALAEYTVVPVGSVRRLPTDIPLHLAALLGCAVITGVGAVLRTAGVRPGESVAIIGLGGVGLSAVQGARIAGANPIIAIDPVPEKLDLARSMGATVTVPAGDSVRSAVRDATNGRGADHVLDCVGLATTIRDGWKLLRRGGHFTLVGIGAKTEKVEFSSLELYHFARTISICVSGAFNPDADLPTYLDHIRTARLDLPALVTRESTLDEVPQGFTDLAAGTVARVLIRP
jgi:S-(hydroxymethyl)glutathione dehydrogenase/alcohol dehydrogenase